MDTEDEIVELGAVSVETKGRVSGPCYEQSVLPYKFLEPTGGCTFP